MSEYQYYEWMAVDRPLTGAQIEKVENLSSHIDVSSSHAFVEYHWGDFKYDPLNVLYKYFDGFLYWANWGSPQLAFRFPHGVFSPDLLAEYGIEHGYLADFVTFTEHKDYDILDIQLQNEEPPDEIIGAQLKSLIAIREELMEGDLRALYIVWLAVQILSESGYNEEEDEDYEITLPAVPLGFDKLTAAQKELANFLQVPDELLAVVALHSGKKARAAQDDFVAWVKLLPAARRDEYLARLAGGEAGLSRQLVKELRELGRGKFADAPPAGERVTYARLLVESKAMKAELERKRREKEQEARRRHLQSVYEKRNARWQQVEMEAQRGIASGYEAAVNLLVDLRAAADQFNDSQDFQERFQAWLPGHRRRPSLLRRLQERGFPLPDM